MAIPAEFSSKYSNEEQFREQFLIPLLHRAGYSVVVNYHGKQEFGKDLVFGEIDAFGHMRYHGLQAKYVGSIGQGEAQDLVNDCKEAYQNPFRHPQTGIEESLDLFYVVNGGSISDNAKTIVFNAMRGEHGGHVRIIDGLGLLALDRLLAIRRAENISAVLVGMRNDCIYNLQMLQRIVEHVARKLADDQHPVTHARMRLAGVESYLVRPLPIADIDVTKIEHVWHRADSINRWLNVMVGIGISRENRRSLLEGIASEAGPLNTDLGIVLACSLSAMKKLGPIASDG